MKYDIYIEGKLSQIEKIMPIKATYKLEQVNKDVSIQFDEDDKSIILRYLFTNNAVTITKDNIHLYYEFMSDDDLIQNRRIITDSLDERREYILLFFKNKTSLKGQGQFFGVSGFVGEDISKINKLDMTYGNYVLKQTIFGANDTLKPIDEYIAEIKASDSYLEYISTK